ncbi:MAG: hypothetical protein AAB895_04235 [Patescibacteria group bacterium]
MFKTLLDLSPEQIFLLQGNQETFARLVADVSNNTTNLDQQSLSRFTVENAQDAVLFNLERENGAWCVIYFDVFVADAAQVLLKTLEEPKEGIHIVFVTPHPYLIPQTIRSRVRLVPSTIEMAAPEYLSSKKTLQEYIKETFSSDSDEDASVRRAHATVLFDALEYHVRNDPEKTKAVYEAKDMLFKANMPTKQVVEYLVAMIF